MRKKSIGILVLVVAAFSALVFAGLRFGASRTSDRVVPASKAESSPAVAKERKSSQPVRQAKGAAVHKLPLVASDENIQDSEAAQQDAQSGSLDLPEGPGIVPVQGDYDGDGVIEQGRYDTSTGKWYIKGQNGKEIVWGIKWGGPRMTPVCDDYDGDGVCDLAVDDMTKGKRYVISVSGKIISYGEKLPASDRAPGSRASGPGPKI